jgi:hypothetical protein
MATANRTQAQRTPGPWRVGYENPAVSDSFTPKNAVPIVAQFPPFAFGGVVAAVPEVSPADARLIAESPAMRDLLAEIEDYGVPRFNARIREILDRIDGK